MEHTISLTDERFVLKSKTRNILLGGIVIGIVLLILGIILMNNHENATGKTFPEHLLQKRIWANLLINSYYFSGFAIIGTFFIAVLSLANAGWHIGIKRVPEAIAAFLPIGALLLALVFIFGKHDLYHWTHEGIMDTDKILAGKQAYLNVPFLVGRVLVIFAVWILLSWLIRKASREEDDHGGTVYLDKTVKYSAIFTFFFAFTMSMLSWDLIMSLEPHWFSTMFSVYNFATLWVSGIAVITLFVLFLKKEGYLQFVNDDILHDLGKLMFAFSIFWTYIWFSQFMLIWYANLPEESVYFYERVTPHWKPYFLINLAINFVFPFFVLMTRDAKRNKTVLAITAIVLFLGHYNDVFLMVMPGTVGDYAHIGLVEIGITLIFAACFIFVVLTALARANIFPKKHPYLLESLQHDVGV
jgi:hypothetical protein